MKAINSILDKLTVVRISQAQQPLPDQDAGLTPEEVLALKYKPGQKIIDQTTGKEVTIIGGTRISVKI